MTDENKGVDPKEKLGLIPEVKYNKNGFEIRSDIVSIAADFVKWQFEATVNSKHPITHIPTYADVLEAATAWNEFVIRNCKTVQAAVDDRFKSKD